ncbi:hypothetical protein [Polaromonas sp. CG9_12]|nr:hypothetical protein [Polaromonas sp. CG9_12]
MVMARQGRSAGKGKTLPGNFKQRLSPRGNCRPQAKRTLVIHAPR